MQFIKAHNAEFILGLAVLVVFQFWVIMGYNSRLSSVRRLVRSLLTGPGGEDLEALLRQYRAESTEALEQCSRLAEHQTRLDMMLRGCLQHVGLIRFDAYTDVSGHQSFSMAMLNGNLDGMIVTSLYGRTDGRCYGKAVTSGKTEIALSTEEQHALEMALSDAGSSLETNGKARRNGQKAPEA